MFKLIYILSLLVILSLVSAQGSRKECAKCRKSFQCAGNSKCWNKKCTNKDDMSGSMLRCFKQRCDSCNKDTDCVTEHCAGGKCVESNDPTLADRCSSSKLRPECARCTGDRQCSTSKCWGTKCVFDTPASMEKCGFKELCQPCKVRSDCLSQLCKGGLCVKQGQRCTGSQVCGSCNSTNDCATGYCFRSVCVKRNRKSKLACGFKNICDSCSANNDCLSGKCVSGACRRSSGQVC